MKSQKRKDMSTTWVILSLSARNKFQRDKRKHSEIPGYKSRTPIASELTQRVIEVIKMNYEKVS